MVEVIKYDIGRQVVITDSNSPYYEKVGVIRAIDKQEFEWFYEVKFENHVNIWFSVDQLDDSIMNELVRLSQEMGFYDV